MPYTAQSPGAWPWSLNEACNALWGIKCDACADKSYFYFTKNTGGKLDIEAVTGGYASNKKFYCSRCAKSQMLTPATKKSYDDVKDCWHSGHGDLSKYMVVERRCPFGDITEVPVMAWVQQPQQLQQIQQIQQSQQIQQIQQMAWEQQIQQIQQSQQTDASRPDASQPDVSQQMTHQPPHASQNIDGQNSTDGHQMTTTLVKLDKTLIQLEGKLDTTLMEVVGMVDGFMGLVKLVERIDARLDKVSGQLEAALTQPTTEATALGDSASSSHSTASGILIEPAFVSPNCAD